MIRCWLRKMRENKGLTQILFADAISITQAYYSEIENGKCQPDMSYSMMEKIANALGVPVQEIIDAENEYRANRNGKKKAPGGAGMQPILKFRNRLPMLTARLVKS